MKNAQNVLWDQVLTSWSRVWGPYHDDHLISLFFRWKPAYKGINKDNLHCYSSRLSRLEAILYSGYSGSLRVKLSSSFAQIVRPCCDMLFSVVEPTLYALVGGARVSVGAWPWPVLPADWLTWLVLKLLVTNNLVISYCQSWLLPFPQLVLSSSVNPLLITLFCQLRYHDWYCIRGWFFCNFVFSVSDVLMIDLSQSTTTEDGTSQI